MFPVSLWRSGGAPRRGSAFAAAICLHHRFGGLTSHHYNEAHGFIREFTRRGKEFRLFVSSRAPAREAAELGARAVLDDPTFRLEWSFEERSRRFREAVLAHVEPGLAAEDCVLCTIATQLEAHALVRWLEGMPPARRPWVVALFLSDRWNRSGPAEHERQLAEFAVLRAAIGGLPAEALRRIVFCTVTEGLAAELAGLLGVDVGLTTMPLEYGPRPWWPRLRLSRRAPRVAVLGGTRREKGSHLLPDIVRACRGTVAVEFLVHLTNNSLAPEEVRRLARIGGEPGVAVIREAMTLPRYRQALAGADLALFPYEVVPYRQRTSGVFAEAVAGGKPVVATAGTWLAAQIAAGRAAGTIIERLEPESVAGALARAVADLGALRRSARAGAGEWRARVCTAAFVDYVEDEIARRSSAGAASGGGGA